MTTTDTDALWDTVHAALTLTPEVRGRIAQEPSRDIRASLRLAAQINAVLPIVAVEVRKAKAEALREAAERARSELGWANGGHTSTYSVRHWLRVLATEYETRRQR